jgi:hypothetical protein
LKVWSLSAENKFVRRNAQNSPSPGLRIVPLLDSENVVVLMEKLESQGWLRNKDTEANKKELSRQIQSEQSFEFWWRSAENKFFRRKAQNNPSPEFSDSRQIMKKRESQGWDFRFEKTTEKNGAADFEARRKGKREKGRRKKNEKKGE